MNIGLYVLLYLITISATTLLSWYLMRPCYEAKIAKIIGKSSPAATAAQTVELTRVNGQIMLPIPAEFGFSQVSKVSIRSKDNNSIVISAVDTQL